MKAGFLPTTGRRSALHARISAAPPAIRNREPTRYQGTRWAGLFLLARRAAQAPHGRQRGAKVAQIDLARQLATAIW